MPNPSGRILPTGTITLLFTDIEGSTRLLQQLGNRYADVLSEHHRLMRTAFEDGGGHEVDTEGDAFFVAFENPRNAVVTAVKAQQSLMHHSWPDDMTVKVRMGLHTGTPLSADTGYVGMDVHRAARICSAGHGGQILISRSTRALVEQELPEGISLQALGEHRLQDLARSEELFQLLHLELSADFPPLKSLDNIPNNFPVS